MHLIDEFLMSPLQEMYKKYILYISRVHSPSRRTGTFVLLDFSLTVNAATLIFISGCGSAISSAKEGKSGFIYNLVKS